MAKVVGPLLSLGASKSVGGALTFSNWKGLNTVRIKSNPSNPRTLDQMASRGFFAAGGKVTKRTHLTGDVVSYTKTKTPAQMSWASVFIREMMGTNNINIKAAKTAYNLPANSAKKTLFDTAAAAASIESVDLDGTPNTQVPAGLSLWAAYDGSHRLGDPSAPTTAVTATEAQVNAYTEALTGVTV